MSYFNHGFCNSFYIELFLTNNALYKVLEELSITDIVELAEKVGCKPNEISSIKDNYKSYLVLKEKFVDVETSI